MSSAADLDEVLLKTLNSAQRQAVCHEKGPLLIVAGAGTGKTTTLVHRLAWLIAGGVDPGRTLLLTFTRRSAAEMLRRAGAVLALVRRGARGKPSRRAVPTEQVWGGTFHSIAARLLRMYGRFCGLEPNFTIHDRGDSEDLMHLLRGELNLAGTELRFPKKGTCLDIHSRTVNGCEPLEHVLARRFEWCEPCGAELARLFAAYTERKRQLHVLDYDDLLARWRDLLADGRAGARIRELFDCVLVDEYQDTNRLQGEILKLLRPDGSGITAVGDDAQSIYSFRAATVRNMLDFPKAFPGAAVVALEENYRSTQAILKVSNAVMAQARERYAKELRSPRAAGAAPGVVTCFDEQEQADWLAGRILELRETGIDLRQQAVLFRASHHSMMLEAELTRRRIPFVKYGGLRFIETAHIKDVLAFLRLVENPRDVVAGLRVLLLLDGIGPKKAQQLMELLGSEPGPFSAWESIKPPKAAAAIWPKLVQLVQTLACQHANAGNGGARGNRAHRKDRGAGQPAGDLASQITLVREFYDPILEQRYDHVPPRRRDLEQLEQVASRYADRRAFLAELTLDPPTSSEDFAGRPHLDDDYLILSTIHSAKGLEWEAVYVIHAADGNIPSDMALRDDEELEEERRLFYVALTRAKRHLYICHPLRYYLPYHRCYSDAANQAQATRFLTKTVLAHCERLSAAEPVPLLTH